MRMYNARIGRKCQSKWAWIAAVVIFLANGNSFADQDISETTEPGFNQSMVFVVDVSSSMFDIMEDVRNAVQTYVNECRTGESIALVRFGARAEVVFRREIKGAFDRQRLLGFCNELSSVDQFTNIPCAIKRGLEELRKFHEKDATGSHVLVLMSDGKNNPPRGSRNPCPVTYEDVVKEFDLDFQPGEDWYLLYVVLKGDPDTELQAFVKECKGHTVELHSEAVLSQAVEKTGAEGPNIFTISEVRISPGRRLKVADDKKLNLEPAWPPVEVAVPIRIEPLKGKPAGLKIGISGSITGERGESGELTIDVNPSEIVCGTEPMETSIMLSILGDWENDIHGSLSFGPSGKRIVIPRPSKLDFRIEEKSGFIVDSSNPILLGPLKPWGSYATELSVEIRGITPDEALALSYILDMDLPYGVSCSAGVTHDPDSEKRLSAWVKADVAEDVELPDDTTWSGKLVAMGSTHSGPFSQDLVSLTVFTETQVASYWNIPWRFVGPALFACGLIFYSVRYGRRFLKTELPPVEGWLVALEMPESSKIQNVDLQKLSKNLGKGMLVVGNNPGFDIYTPFETEEKFSIQLSSGRARRSNYVRAKNVGWGKVKVNDLILKKEVNVRHGDTIKIDPYLFMYSETSIKHLAVHYDDGSIEYGMLLSCDPTEAGFYFTEQNELGDDYEKTTYVLFSELKGIFFVLDSENKPDSLPRSQPAGANKIAVVIEFLDGEKMEGHTTTQYHPEARRFFVFPKPKEGEEQNYLCVLVERGFTKEVRLLNHSKTTEELIILLNNPDPDIRVSAASELGQLKETRALEPLLEQLTHPGSNYEYLAKMVRAIAMLGEASAVPRMLEVLELPGDKLSEGDQKVYLLTLIQAMGNLRHEQAYKVLVRFHDHPLVQVRREVIRQFFHYPCLDTMMNLIWHLDDPDMAVRHEANRALVMMAGDTPQEAKAAQQSSPETLCSSWLTWLNSKGSNLPQKPKI